MGVGDRSGNRRMGVGDRSGNRRMGVGDRSGNRRMGVGINRISRVFMSDLVSSRI